MAINNKKLKLEELDRVNVDQFKQLKKIELIIVLDNIRSHHNVGSVFRTADAFKVSKILLCGYTPCPPHRDIHKTALGATDSVDWTYFKSTTEAVEWLKNENYVVYAIEQTENSLKLDQLNINTAEKYALVFGNEVGGVDQEVIDLCNGSIEIPQYGTKHSLNISVCAGIVMWDFFKPLNRS